MTHVDERELASESLLGQWCERVCGAGYRGTGTAEHDALITWVVEQVREIPGFAVRTDDYDLLGWHPVPEGDLERAGTLRSGSDEIAVAGAVLVSPGFGAPVDGQVPQIVSFGGIGTPYPRSGPTPSTSDC